jgi:holdfast attachment protein HfaA
MAYRNTKRSTLMAASCIAIVGMAGAAQAQTMNANSAAFNAGYGRYSGQENQPVDASLTDANGNLINQNGLFESGGTSIFAGSSARLAAAGAGSSFSGAGSIGSASAIGNNLNVIVQGTDNTVIVTSSQTNTGNVTATVNTNGKP